MEVESLEMKRNLPRGARQNLPSRGAYRDLKRFRDADDLTLFPKKTCRRLDGPAEFHSILNALANVQALNPNGLADVRVPAQPEAERNQPDVRVPAQPEAERSQPEA